MKNSGEKLILLIIAVNAILYSVFLYYGSGTYIVAGSYDDVPILQYRGDPEAVLMGLTILVFGILAYYAATHSSTLYRYIYLLGLLALIASIMLVGLKLVYSGTVRYFYGGYTDSYVLQVEASKLMLEGVNPYSVSYHSVLEEMLREGRIFATVTWIYKDPYPPFRGDEVVGFVDVFDYPAAATLYYIPAILFNIPPVIWDGLVYGLSLALAYYRFKRRYRLIYPLILGIGGFIYLIMPLTFTGLPGIIAPMIISLLFPEKPFIPGFMLAWSISYRPYMAVYALFYLIAYWREGYDARRLLLYGVVSGLLINGFFLLMDPVLYISRILAPLTYNLYPYEGFGFSSLYYLGIPVSKTTSMLLLASTTILLLYVSTRYYTRVRYMLFLFPLIILFFYYRPLYGYYVFAPLYSLIALATRFYKKGFDADIDDRSLALLNIIGLFNILMSTLFSGYIEVLGAVPFIDYLAVITLLSAPLLVYYIVVKGVVEFKPFYGSVLIVLSFIAVSITVLNVYSDQYMVLSDRDKYSPPILQLYYSIGKLFEGLNPYLGGVSLSGNTTRIRIYSLTGGVRLVASYPDASWSRLRYLCYGSSGDCILDSYTGFPGLLLFYSPIIFLGGFRLYNALLFSLLLTYLYYRFNSRRSILLYLWFTALPFYILSPWSKPSYIWFILLVFLVEAISRKSLKLIVYGLLSISMIEGLLYSIYRITCLKGIRISDVVKYYLSVIAAITTLFILYDPLRVLWFMILPYTGLETVYGYCLALLFARYMYSSIYVLPLIPLSGMMFYALLLAVSKNDRILWMNYPSTLIPWTHSDVLVFTTVNTWILHSRRLGG